MSLQRCKRETSSTEFVLWKVYMEEEVNDFHREDYYLAQIACVVAKMGMGEKGSDITAKDFILKFQTSAVIAAEEKRRATDQTFRDQKMAESKAAWGASLGMVLG